MVIKKYEGIVTIEIDEDKCTGDGECIDTCPVNVFELMEGKAHAVRVDDCTECCVCIDACPTKAIKHSSC